MTVQDEQSQESAKFVSAALLLKKAEVKLGIPLLNTGPGPLKIDVDSARRSNRVRCARADDEPEQPQQPAPGRPAARRVRAKMGPHTRRCNVCRHPHRKDIEQEFLRWRSPDRIAQDYKIPDHSSIYRHVHATGIFARRRKAVRAALEPIIECAEYVKVTASSLIKAVHAYAHINEYGEWVNHPTQHAVIVQHLNAPQENNPPAASEPPSPVATPPTAQCSAKDSPLPYQPSGATISVNDGANESPVRLRCHSERSEEPAVPVFASAGSNDPLQQAHCHPEPREGSALAVSLNSASAQSTELNRQIQELEQLQLSENKGRRPAQIAKKIKNALLHFSRLFCHPSTKSRSLVALEIANRS